MRSRQGATHLLCCALLFTSLLAGGAGIDSPFASAIVQIAALPLLFWLFIAYRPGEVMRAALGNSDSRSRIGIGGLLIVIVALIVPLIQLIPLPPAIWTALPGRQILADAAGFVGADDSWQPISMVPAETTNAVLQFIPGLILLVGTLLLSERNRVILFLVVLLGGVLGLLLSMVQIAMPAGSVADIYGRANSFLPVGFFANRNHTATFMLACAAIAAALAPLVPSRHRSIGQLALAGLALAFLVGALATRSRSGVLLAPLVVIAAGWIFINGDSRAARWSGIGSAVNKRILLAIGAVVIAVGLLSTNYILPNLLSRFDNSGGGRALFWEDVIYAIGVYFPVGSGIGTFAQVFQSAERLEMVSPRYVNQAHNEYLQVAMEAGPLGVALLCAAIAWVVIASVRAWRMPLTPTESALARASSMILWIVLLHSIVDYPLRTLAYQAVVALAIANLVLMRPLHPRARSGMNATI